MYRLHTVEKMASSWALRIWLLLHELNIPFTEVTHAYQTDLAAQRRAWRAFSPTAKVPVLDDGDVRVWDSLAITEYLAESHPQIWPIDPVARAWARCAAAEMHSGFGILRQTCPFDGTVNKPLTASNPDLTAELERINQLWNQGLETFGGPFLAGSVFSAADAFYAPVVSRIRSYHLHDYFTDAAHTYIETILALKGMHVFDERARS